MRDHFVKHISDPQHGSRRNRDRFPDSQIIKLIDIRHILFEIIDFIDHKHDRLFGTAQHVCHLFIRIHKPLSDIRYKHDHIRCVDRDLRLLPHLGKNDIITVRLDSSGIDQGKCFI